MRDGDYPPGVTGKMIDALEGPRKCPVRKMCRAADRCEGFDWECPDFDRITDKLNDIPFADEEDDFIPDDFEEDEE